MSQVSSLCKYSVFTIQTAASFCATFVKCTCLVIVINNYAHKRNSKVFNVEMYLQKSKNKLCLYKVKNLLHQVSVAEVHVTRRSSRNSSNIESTSLKGKNTVDYFSGI